MTGVSSPLSTGGAGTVFEQHVGAMFLALLLTRGIPVIFRDYQVDKVDFQTSRLGWETDDLLVTCSSENITRKMAIQIRRSFAVRKSDGCKETIQKFWNDFNADRFNPDRDALILVTLHRTKNLGGFDNLLTCARSSPGAADFKDRLETSGFVSDAAKRCHQEIRSIVDNTDPSGSISEERFWRFLKKMYVLFLDFTTDTAQHEAMVTQLLVQSLGDSDAIGAARDTWHELVGVASDAASRAKPFCRSDLPASLLEQYSAISAPKLQKLMDHSTTILNGIYSTIGEAATLPRTEVTTQTSIALGNRVVALTGPPGSGKSALAKTVIKQHSGNHLCLSFRATEFAKNHIDDVLLGTISGEQFKLLVKAQERVLIYIDSFERLLECSVRDAFYDLAKIVESCPNVSLMLTCRDNELENAVAAFFSRSSLTCHNVMVPPLSADEIEWVCKDNPSLRIPISHPELKQVMGTPYVLDMAARMDWSNRQDIPADIMAFQKKWWSEIVRNDGDTMDGLPDRREQALVNLAVYRARELRPLVPTDGMDKGALDRLCKDGIVMMGDGGLAALAHDVIEDWAVIHWIGSCALKHEWLTCPMAEDVGTHPAIRRGFREWLRERLDADSAEADRFVSTSYGDDSLPRIFRDDVLISVLLSGSVGNFVSRQKDRLLEDDARLFVKMLHLMRVACTKTPDVSGDQPACQSMLSEPEGEAWQVLLHAVDENHDRLLPRYSHHLLGLLEDWVRGTKSSAIPDGAAPAIRIAHRLLELSWDYNDNNFRKRIFGIIASVPKAESANFLYLVDQAWSKSGWRNTLLDELRQILTGPSGLPACRDHPEEMAKFVMSLRLIPEQGLDTIEYGTSFDSESKFGLRVAAKAGFRHFSAFCGPFLGLLKHHPKIGLRLVLDLLNHAGDMYGSQCKDPIQRMMISVPGHGKVEQWANDRLWLAYRGMSEVPHLLMCALMALEYWLLVLCEGRHPVEPLLLEILEASNNVMTTGVVASVCTAYPDLGGGVTQTLLGSQYCIELDGSRRKKEGHIQTLRYAAANRQEKYFDDERKRSDALPHRQRDLELLARELQSQKREEPTSDGEGGGLTPPSDADKANAHHQDRGIPKAENMRTDASTPLYDWGLKRWRRDFGKGNAEPWQRILTLARDGAERYVESEWVHFTKNGPPVVAAVCVRDHWGEMSADERRWCTNALVAEVERCSDYTYNHALASSVDSDSIASHSLPKILANDPDNRKILEVVALSLTHTSPAVCLSSAKGVGEHLEPKHRNLALQCAGTVAILSNLSAGTGQCQAREGRTSIPDRPEDKQDAPELARRALVNRSVDTKAELEDLDLASRHGRDAAVYIVYMLGRAPDLSVTKQLIAKVGRAVVGACTDEHEVLWSPDQEFGHRVMDGLAEIILSLPHTMRDYFQSFLKMVDTRPDRVAFFIGSLTTHMDGSSAGRPFWDVWDVFADRITKSPWIYDTVSGNSKGATLIRRMMFDPGWLEGPRRWEYLVGHEERVCGFVNRLPPTPYVLASFAHYLYVSGAGSRPLPLKTVAGLLRTGNPTKLLDNEDTVYCLACVLQRYVYGRPAMLKTDRALRKDTILVLDRLVDAGSSAAYRMRDNFATLNVDK